MAEQKAIVAQSLIPSTLEEIRGLGEIFAKSGMFSDVRDAAQAIVKILAGRELGLPPLMSMTKIYIVKGQVAISATAMAALIKQSGVYDYRIAELTNERCTVIFFERGQEVFRSTFTIEDAKRAGVAGGDSWQKYPRNMLFARALSNGARFVCPHLLAGVYVPDELTENVSVHELEAPAVPEAPAAAAEPKPEPQQPAAKAQLSVATPEQEKALRLQMVKLGLSKQTQERLIEHWKLNDASGEEIQRDLERVAETKKRFSEADLRLFWSRVTSELGLSDLDMHARLGVPTIYLWPGTLEEAFERLQAEPDRV
jgi:hypothetical protein